MVSTEITLVGLQYQLPELGDNDIELTVRFVPFFDINSQRRRVSVVAFVQDGRVVAGNGAAYLYQAPDPSRRYPEGHIGMFRYATGFLSKFGTSLVRIHKKPNSSVWICVLVEGQERASSQEQSLTYPSPSVWHYDDNGYYGYVLVSGEPSVVRQFEQALTEHGLGCILSGRSYRRANNGRQYDWYIRVVQRAVGDSYIKPKRSLIASALQSLGGPSPFPKGTEHIPSVDQTALLREELQQGLAKISKAEAEIKHKDRLLDEREQTYRRLTEQHQVLQNAAEQQKNSYEQQRESLEQRIYALAEELDSLRRTTEQFSVEQVTLASVRIEELQRALSEREKEKAELERERADLEDVWRESEEHRDSLLREILAITNERDIARAEFQQVADRLQELDGAAIGREDATFPADSLLRTEQELEGILTILLPNISLVGGSISFLAMVKDVEPALRHLHQLCHDHANVRGKRVKGAKDWLELVKHISTGDSDDGRIYYRSRKGKPTQFDVLVSHKNLQERHDIPWLARQQ